MDLILLLDMPRLADPPPNPAVYSLHDTRWIKPQLRRGLWRYDTARLQAYRLSLVRHPAKVAWLMRLLARGACSWDDETGRVQPITTSVILKYSLKWMRDGLRVPELFRRTRRDLADLQSTLGWQRYLDITGRPVYLRTDFVFGQKAGGAVAHIAGVLNHLNQFTGAPILLSTDTIPTIHPTIEAHCLQPDDHFWDWHELPALHFNAAAERQAWAVLRTQPIAFFYQRYSVYSYFAVRLARQYRVPLVLEYNSPVAWVSRLTGKRLRNEALAVDIETLSMRAADVVVTVSRLLRDELIARGIDADKILVNPMGVDPNRHSPKVDGSAVRARYGLEGKTVAGYMGVFGLSHGVDVLAEAWGQFMRARPEYSTDARLLLMGDGFTIPDVRATVARHHVEDTVVFTGTVPQAEGPAHLAACDVLAAPYVPKPDHIPFYGSPTKLFEYMAMGKGILTSDLGQISEIVSHDKTAWLSPPGNVDALAHGLKTLFDDEPRRRRLGAAARREAIARHTWREHTRRIIEKLQERSGQ